MYKHIIDHYCVIASFDIIFETCNGMKENNLRNAFTILSFYNKPLNV